MTDATISQSMPDWIKDHIALYRADGDAGHLWIPPRGDSKPLTTLLLTTTGRKSGKQLLLPLIYRPHWRWRLLHYRIKGRSTSASSMVSESNDRPQC